MGNRSAVNEEINKAHDMLLRALRRRGDHTGLIAVRTRRLLQWKPSGIEPAVWLGAMFPEPWHYNKIVAALRATVSSANGAHTDRTEHDKRN